MKILKAQNVISMLDGVQYQIVITMDNAMQMADVFVNEAGAANTVTKLIAMTRHVLTMVFVTMQRVTAKVDGMEKIVNKEFQMLVHR